jgi:hypothetical protein
MGAFQLLFLLASTVTSIEVPLPVSDASGKLFSGKVIRKFQEKRQFDQIVSVPPVAFDFSFNCSSSKWAVVTTIYEPSSALDKVNLAADWCLLVVLDKSSKPNFRLVNQELGNVFILTVKEQDHIAAKISFVDKLPWYSFGRKNVGYLVAIAHGAKLIWDFDDDNEWTVPPTINPARVVTIEPISNISLLAVNPYPLMGSPKPCWPRGFPLDLIHHTGRLFRLKDLPTTEQKAIISQTTVFQSLANHDPDLDAIYRLVLPHPFDFLTSHSLAMPSRLFSPYNAQATLHTPEGYWGLLLPISVHGRVSDIWRSYLTQRLLWEIGGRLIFTAPHVVQQRNSHNYMADMNAELPLYSQAHVLIDFLSNWRGTSSSWLPGLMEELWIACYERGFIELKDVLNLQLWIRSLLQVNYVFPNILPTQQ